MIRSAFDPLFGMGSPSPFLVVAASLCLLHRARRFFDILSPDEL